MFFHEMRHFLQLFGEKFVKTPKHGSSGFSVAFGSTGCRCSCRGRAMFAPMARTLSAGDMNSWGLSGGIYENAISFVPWTRIG